MKRATSTFCLAMIALSVQAADTLRNHTAGLPLATDIYTATGTWGYYAGHNHKMQQQYGERYEVNGHIDVVGVVAHLTGTVSNPNKEIDFRLFDVLNRFPNAPQEDGHADLGDIDLSGGPTIVLFHQPAHIDDSFFVTIDFGDYAHDGLDGDTLGLLYAPSGSRTASDLAYTGRNVIQEHDHQHVIWSDFYSQNFTPIATHFALYPIVAFDPNSIGTITRNGLTIAAPYPNPAVNTLTIPYNLSKRSPVFISLMDMTGRTLQTLAVGDKLPGKHEESINVTQLPVGFYNIVVRTCDGTVAARTAKL